MDDYINITVAPDTLHKLEKKTSPVISIEPWHHGNFKLGNQNIIGRKAWGAKDPIWQREITYYNTDKQPLNEYLNTIVIHHTNNTKDIAKVEHDQGFAAVGYHFFMNQQGKVYEGRPLEIMGSHAGLNKHDIRGVLADPDWGSIGIVLQGDYHCADAWLLSSKQHCENQLNSTLEIQLPALKELILTLKAQFEIKTLLNHNEVERKGKRPWYDMLSVSKKLEPTVCPGDLVSNEIIKLRKTLF